MAIGPIGSTGDSTQPREGGQPSGQPAGGGARGEPAADSCDLSDLAALVEQLDQLLQRDPEGFARLMSAVAERLRAAGASPGAPERAALDQLADDFLRAAAAKSLSALERPETAARPPSHPAVQSYAAQRAPAGGLAARLPGVDLAEILRGALRDLGP